MKDDQNGYIVVETLTSFLLFTFLVASILSLVNIVTVQARIHYALTQTVETMSMYCYILDVTGADASIQGISKRAETARKDTTDFVDNINGVVDGIQSLDASQTYNSGKGAYTQVKDWISDPKEAISKFANLGLDELGKFLFGEGARALMGRYLRNGDLTGEEYLLRANVIDGLNGLDFYCLDLDDASDSRILTDNGDVKLVVTYCIEYKFGALPLPFEPKLKVTQYAITKAWLNGVGTGYTGDK